VKIPLHVNYDDITSLSNEVRQKLKETRPSSVAQASCIPGMTPDEVVKAVIASGIGYDQIIREFDRWTHISVPNKATDNPRRQALIIDKAGTRPYA
jgi:hypothetical protein